MKERFHPYPLDREFQQYFSVYFNAFSVCALNHVKIVSTKWQNWDPSFINKINRYTINGGTSIIQSWRYKTIG